MGIFDKLTKAVELTKDFMDDGQVNGSSGSSSNAVQKIMSQNMHADHEERNQTIPSAENIERTEKSSSEQMTEIRPATQLNGQMNGISLASTSRIVEGQMVLCTVQFQNIERKEVLKEAQNLHRFQEDFYLKLRRNIMTSKCTFMVLTAVMVFGKIMD